MDVVSRQKLLVTRHSSLVTGHLSLLESERLGRLRFRDLRAALLAGAPGVIVPEVEHRLAEVLDDVTAIEVNVFHQRLAVFAVENDMFRFARRTATLDHHAERVRWSHRSMRDIRRDEKRLPFPHQVIDDSVAFTDAHFNVALQLVKKLFRVNHMKIVPRIRPGDDHHEKIAPVIDIPIAHRRFEQMPVLVDPIHQIKRLLHGLRSTAL